MTAPPFDRHKELKYVYVPCVFSLQKINFLSASDILKVSECACHSWLQVLKLQIKTVTGLSCTFSVTLSFNSSTLTRTVIKFMNISKKFETRRHLAICKGNYDFLFVYVFQIDRKCGADLSSQICVKNISNGII